MTLHNDAQLKFRNQNHESVIISGPPFIYLKSVSNNRLV